MNRKRSVGLLLCCTILAIYQRNVAAGPLKALNRFVREIYPEIEPENEANQALVCIVGDVVYGSDEPVSSEQPCLKCKCQPPGVQCETIRCSKKPGCKAIHRPNKCCPDYQCECEHNGNIYTNGERLETQPGGECKVCYCRGGEVKCAEVSCYRRLDCEGKTVPGQCCPKYDHCPPIEPQVGMSQSMATVEREHREPSSVSASLMNTTTVRIEDYNNQNENHILDSTSDKQFTTELIKVDKSTQTEPQKEGPRITIQEIIPEVREIPITEPPASPKPEIDGILVIEEARSPSETVQVSEANDIVTDSDADSSEISEVIQQPPPVLRIGDKLVYLNKEGSSQQIDANNTAPVITIIGAEGLQRGFEDSGEVPEVQVTSASPSESSTVSSTVETSTADEADELELKQSESSHILSLVKRRRKEDQPATNSPEQTTQINDKSREEAVTTEVPPSTGTENVSSEEPNENVTPVSSVEHLSTTTARTSPRDTDQQTTSTSEVRITAETTEKVYLENVHEQNPAYPPIPDIMNPSHTVDTADRFEGDAINNSTTNDGADSDSDSDSDSEMIMRIVPEIFDVKTNRTVVDDIPSEEWSRNEGSLLNPDAALPDSILNQPAGSDYLPAAGPEQSDVETGRDFSNAEEGIVGMNSTESAVTTTIFSSTITLPGETDAAVTEVVAVANASIDSSASRETLEDLAADSGEQTTPKNSHESMMSKEEFDIDSRENITAEIEDMLTSSDGDRRELTTEKAPVDVEMIDHVFDSKQKNKDQVGDPTNNPKLKDVEVISVEAMSNKMDKNIETTTEIHEKLPVPQELVGPTKSIEKRQNSPEDEADIIFKELDAELNGNAMENNPTQEEEEKEAAKIFKELLDETSTPRSENRGADKDKEMVDKLTDALAKLTLKGKGNLDTSILSVLSNFFSKQYRAYDNAQQ